MRHILPVHPFWRYENGKAWDDVFTVCSILGIAKHPCRSKQPTPRHADISQSPFQLCQGVDMTRMKRLWLLLPSAVGKLAIFE